MVAAKNSARSAGSESAASPRTPTTKGQTTSGGPAGKQRANVGFASPAMGNYGSPPDPMTQGEPPKKPRQVRKQPGRHSGGRRSL